MVGLLPAHQGVGANALLYAEMERTIRACGFQARQFGQVVVTNTRSIADHEAVGIRWTRRHRVYRLDLAGGGRL